MKEKEQNFRKENHREMTDHKLFWIIGSTREVSKRPAFRRMAPRTGQ
jgi:hypothetical protein